MQICCSFNSAAADVETAPTAASSKLELTREMIVQLSSIRMLTRSLPDHSKCETYANKLHEFGGFAGEDGSSLIRSAIESLSGGKSQGGQFLLDDLKMCLILLGSGSGARVESDSSAQIVVPEQSKQQVIGEDQLEALRRELDEAKKKFNDTERQLADAKRELKKTKQKFDDSKRKLKVTKQKHDKSKRGHEDTKLKFDATKQKFEDSRRELTESKRELESTKRELEETKRSAAADKELISELSRQLEEEKTSSAELGNDLNAKQSKINSILESKSRQCSTKVTELEDKIDKLQHELRSVKEDSKKELEKKKATIKELQLFKHQIEQKSRPPPFYLTKKPIRIRQFEREEEEESDDDGDDDDDDENEYDYD